MILPGLKGILAKVAAAGGGAVTLNSVDKSGNITLSGANLVADITASTAGAVRATTAKTSGKWFFEAKLNTAPSASSVGVMPGTDSLSSDVGTANDAYGYKSNGQKRNNATNTSYGASYGANAVIGVAVDLTAGAITFLKNGVAQTQAFSGVSGTLYPAVYLSSTGTAGRFTVNFGATAFAYTVPYGYTSWDGSQTNNAVAWNSLDTGGANVTLSNGNLTATSVFSTGARGVTGKSSGKWFFEARCNSTGSTVFAIGIGDAATSLTADVGSGTSNSYSYRADGYRYHNGWSNTGVTYTVGDYIGIALDMDAQTLSYYKNGTLVVTVTGLSGTYYPMFSGTGSASTTVNFGATAFAYSKPSGYSSWDGNQP